MPLPLHAKNPTVYSGTSENFEVFTHIQKVVYTNLQRQTQYVRTSVVIFSVTSRPHILRRCRDVCRLKEMLCHEQERLIVFIQVACHYFACFAVAIFYFFSKKLVAV